MLTMGEAAILDGHKSAMRKMNARLNAERQDFYAADAAARRNARTATAHARRASAAEREIAALEGEVKELLADRREIVARNVELEDENTQLRELLERSVSILKANGLVDLYGIR